MNGLTGLQADSVPYLLQERARRYPRHTAYVFPEWDQRYTWRKVWQEVLPLAQGLVERGIRKGDKIAFLMTGRMELIVAMYAAACVGAVLVPINAYSKKDELAGYLKEAEASMLIIGVDGHRQHYPSMLRQLVDENGPEAEWLTSAIYVVGGSAGDRQGFRPYSELPASRPPSDQLIQALRNVTGQDPLVLLFTSGTLGVPKAVLRTTASFFVPAKDEDKPKSWFGAAADALGARVMQAFKMLNLLPLYHMGGFGTILTNLKAIKVPTVMLSRFHPIEALSLIESERCKIVVGTPYMMQRMVSSPERSGYDLTSLLGAAFTSAAVTPAILEQVTGGLRLQFFTVSYGSSEAGAVANGTCIRKEHLRGVLIPLLFRLFERTNLLGGLIEYGQFMKESSSLAGKVESSVEIRVVDPVTGEELPAGGQGEICIRGHRVMRYTNADAERPVFTEDGWYRSGDLGWLNEKRELTIAGRIHRIISRGGEKISPTEIEAVIMQHGDVEDAFVIGVPDGMYGEEICACVVPRRGSGLTAERLKADLAPSLSAFKLPRDFLFLPQLPLSPTGKISVAEMRKLALQQFGDLRRHA
ncbi:class I adenylate-forming enzyme family protein [Paenibacillus soyae]|uniref:Acyl--CoA ligase n=1 Tax=Paenibacillus soyae TaxID=2969249 RepID=A0A9X2MNW6_9BACL|nr:class I adenylate-forming enzyme family protein [Paenibacillus soyae]MCR2803522.1 acyl--CoA ligase [Paenibacillus soyae]